MNVPKLFSLSPRFVLSLCRPLHSCIPVHPVVPPHEAHKGKTFKKISEKDIEHLERLSLVDFGNLRGIQRLEEAIAFAQPLKEVDTSGIEPLYTVLEDQPLVPKIPEECTNENGNVPRKVILANAAKTEEDYFVAPPGNVPLKVQTDKYN